MAPSSKQPISFSRSGSAGRAQLKTQEGPARWVIKSASDRKLVSVRGEYVLLRDSSKPYPRVVPEVKGPSEQRESPPSDSGLELLMEQARAAREKGPRAPRRTQEERREISKAYSKIAYRLTETERAELVRRMRQEADPDEQLE